MPKDIKKLEAAAKAVREALNVQCVQCGVPMERAYGQVTNEGAKLSKAPFCEQPDCPNYGLLQTGMLPAKKSK